MDNRLLVVKIRRNSDGEITDVMLHNGDIYPIDEALRMSEDGLVEKIIVRQGKNGREYYRDNPTSIGDDSFEHIPEF